MLKYAILITLLGTGNPRPIMAFDVRMRRDVDERLPPHGVRIEMGWSGSSADSRTESHRVSRRSGTGETSFRISHRLWRLFRGFLRRRSAVRTFGGEG